MGLQSAADDVPVYRLISVLGSKLLTPSPPPPQKSNNNIKSKYATLFKTNNSGKVTNTNFAIDIFASFSVSWTPSRPYGELLIIS